jgi:hypothetical protein
VARQPLADHVAQAGDVAVDRQHLLARVVARGDRVAGVRRIDEHEVEVLEPAERVVLHLVGRRQHGAVVADAQALRAHRAQLQPDRGRARAAVEREAHRARLGVAGLALELVGRREHRGLGLAALVGLGRVDDRDEGALDLVVQLLAAQLDRAGAALRRGGQQLLDRIALRLLGLVGIGLVGGGFGIGHELPGVEG